MVLVKRSRYCVFPSHTHMHMVTLGNNSILLLIVGVCSVGIKDAVSEISYWDEIVILFNNKMQNISVASHCFSNQLPQTIVSIARHDRPHVHLIILIQQNNILSSLISIFVMTLFAGS